MSPVTSPEVFVVLAADREACVAMRRALDADPRASALLRRTRGRFVEVDELAAPLRAALPGVGVLVVDGDSVLARFRGLQSPRAFVAFVERALRRARRGSELEDPIERARGELAAGFPARCLERLRTAADDDPAAIDLRVRAHLEEGEVAAARAACEAGGPATARVTRALVALAERRLTAVLSLLEGGAPLCREERLLRARAWFERGDGPRAQAEFRDLARGDDEVAIDAERMLTAAIDPSMGHSHR